MALLGLTLRLVHLASIRAIPFFDYPIGDGRSYYDWAGRIAGGDWLGDQVFYQAPLYPYLLGLLRAVGGDGFWCIYVAQSLMGAAACALLVYAGAWFLSRRSGIVAGVMMALYPPAIFYDGVIQKATLAGFLMALLLFLLGVIARRPSLGAVFLAGGVLGLMALTRENALVLVPVVGLWVFLHGGGFRGKRAWAQVGLCAAGLLVVLLPVALRNLKVGDSFSLTTSQMGTNFYIGNGPDADGTYVPLLPGRADPAFERADAIGLARKAVGAELTPSEVSRYWLRRSLEHIRGNPKPWLGLMARKWLLTWHAYEVPDAEDYGLYRRFSPVLRALGSVWHFGVLLPLALVGAVLWWPERRRLWVLHAATLALGASVTIFYVFGRYRFPMVPILMLLSGGAIARGVAALRRPRRHAVSLSCAVFVALLVAFVANTPEPTGEGGGPSLYNLARIYASRGNTVAAEETYRRDIALHPDFIFSHYNLANLLRLRGHLDGAISEYRDTIRLSAKRPWASPYVNLGIALAQKDDLAGAQKAFREALRIDPDNENARRNLEKCEAILRARSMRWQPDTSGAP